MSMKYSLLRNGVGVILTRHLHVADNSIRFSFENAPLNATVIFDRDDGTSLYRRLDNGECDISVRYLRGGVFRVTVAVLDSGNSSKWKCEEIRATMLPSGEICISPNDMDLPQRVVDLYVENEKLHREVEDLTGKIKALEDRLQALYDGHDFI